MREFLEEDAIRMYELNSDPDVIRYTGDDPFASVDAARDFIQQYDAYTTAGYGRLTVLLKRYMEYVGWCGLKYDASVIRNGPWVQIAQDILEQRVCHGSIPQVLSSLDLRN